MTSTSTTPDATRADRVFSPANKIYVYEAPVRLWHWVNALCILVLCVTGYFIGLPPPSVGGEASMSFAFGYIRTIHFAAGQILVLAFLYRIIWALFGNRHSRQIFSLPLLSGTWWKELWHEIAWYGFVAKYPKRYVGHNPVARLAMVLIFVLPLINAIFTGLALYAEGQGIETWWYAWFGWVFSLYGESMTVHTIHRLTMWIIVVFSIVHIYAACREDIMSRQSVLSTMVSGWRFFKDDSEWKR